MDAISALTMLQSTASPTATQAAQQAQAAGDGPRGVQVEASEISRSANVDNSNMLSDAASRVMGNIHSTIERLGREVDIVETADPSPADEAKSALVAESGDLAPGGPLATGEASPNGPESNLAMLNKSFDHAMFMAMINQVISGVGDSSRTLIRQA